MNPGWIPVIFGADNTDTTTTMTFATSQTDDIKTDVKISNTATFVSQSSNDVLDVLAFKDQTFGTVLYAVKGTPVLQGGITVAEYTGLKAVAKAASER